MKKINKWQVTRIVLKRTKKTLKRRRRGKRFDMSTYIRGLHGRARKIGTRQRQLTLTELDKFLKEINFIDPYIAAENEIGNHYITFPEDSRLDQNYRQVMLAIRQFYTCLHTSKNKVVLSFAQCKKLSLPTVFVIKALLHNYQQHQRKCTSLYGGNIAKFPQVAFIQSRNGQINAFLSTIYNLKRDREMEEKDEMRPIYYLPFTPGGSNRKTYTENSKGNACKTIIRFVNNSMKRQGYALSRIGTNNFDKLISEILNNAEDHNLFHEWYVMGTLFEADNGLDGPVVGRLELVFLNFGFSIYEGFDLTKDTNSETYQKMDALYETIQRSNPESLLRNFTREDFFTLFALQEGVSRLKYKRESRGTGTVNFINAFMDLGGYVDRVREYEPELSILSGKTSIKCDTQYKPKFEDDMFILSLNSENDITKAPSDRHLAHLKDHFPGTLLSVKVYLSSEHFEQIIRRNESTNNGA